jgi:hypothetical protein
MTFEASPLGEQPMRIIPAANRRKDDDGIGETPRQLITTATQRKREEPRYCKRAGGCETTAKTKPENYYEKKRSKKQRYPEYS